MSSYHSQNSFFKTCLFCSDMLQLLWYYVARVCHLCAEVISNNNSVSLPYAQFGRRWFQRRSLLLTSENVLFKLEQGTNSLIMGDGDGDSRKYSTERKRSSFKDCWTCQGADKRAQLKKKTNAFWPSLPSRWHLVPTNTFPSKAVSVAIKVS